jgi:DNA-binding transcriptional ArsR family regulator
MCAQIEAMQASAAAPDAWVEAHGDGGSEFQKGGAAAPPEKVKKFSCQAGGHIELFNHMVKHSSRSLDATFAALADPTRRRILEALSKGQRRVTHLAEPFSISLPAVSRHLRVLEDAGLLKRKRHGREHRIELDSAPMREALRWIERYRKFWEGSLEALAHYLENNNQPNQRRKL